MNFDRESSEPEIWERLSGATGSDRVDLLTQLVDFALGREETGQARVLAEEALAEAKLLENPDDLGMAHFTLARVFDLLDDSETSISNLKEAMVFAEVLGDLRLKAESARHLARLLRGQGEFGEALEVIETAYLAVRDYAADDFLTATIIRQRGLLLEVFGRHSESVSCYTQAIDLLREIGDHGALVHLHMDLARTEGLTGKPAEAVRLYRIALDSAELLGLDDCAGQIHYQLALLCLKTKDWKEVAHHLSFARAAAQARQGLEDVVECELIEADLLWAMSDTEGALDAIGRAASGMDLLQFGDFARVDDRRANWLTSLKRYREGVEYFSEVARTAEPDRAESAYTYWAEMLMGLGDFDAVVEVLRSESQRVAPPITGSANWLWRESLAVAAMRELCNTAVAARHASWCLDVGSSFRSPLDEARLREAIAAGERNANQAQRMRGVAIALYLEAGLTAEAERLSAILLEAERLHT